MSCRLATIHENLLFSEEYPQGWRAAGKGIRRAAEQIFGISNNRPM
jgi:hypothetical protein